jgi:hypothetical protein
LTVESIDDLTKILRGMGYSRNAVNEILEWYRENGSNLKT